MVGAENKVLNGLYKKTGEHDSTGRPVYHRESSGKKLSYFASAWRIGGTEMWLRSDANCPPPQPVCFLIISNAIVNN